MKRRGRPKVSPAPDRVRFVFVDCEIEKDGMRLQWRHLVAEGSVDETIRIVETANPGTKAKRA